MRIAFVSTILSYPWGGADTLWTKAAEEAARRGDELLISVSPVVAAHPRIAALGAKIVPRLPLAPLANLGERLTRKLGRLLRRPDPLLAALRPFHPDLVVFSLGGTYDLILHPEWWAWLRASGARFRIVANWQKEHPSLDDCDLALTREIFAAADSVNFVSTRNLIVTRRHLLTALPNARVIHNPLRWQPSDVTPWPESMVARLATVSRLDEGKGIHLLLHALAQAGSDLPAWQLTVFGVGPHESMLRATVAQLKLDARVTFPGYVKELRAIWAEQQLLCSPAINDGVPMTIPEAMLCERPVLATCVGGAEDWIRAGETGFLCHAPTVPLLVIALHDAFAARERWQEMGRAAAIVVKSHYCPDDYLRVIT